MKKHILSNYLKTVQYNYMIGKESTYITSTKETSDPDEFALMHHSNNIAPDRTFTHSIETTDPDEFIADSTLESRTIETSDPDYSYDTTQTTFVLEKSDPDEFYCK